MDLSLFMNALLGVVHKLHNGIRGRGLALVLHYVTDGKKNVCFWHDGGGVVKLWSNWRYVIYEQPLAY